MQISIEDQDKIIFFAFRKSQKVFFDNFLASCPRKKLNIVTSKKSYFISFKSFRKIHAVQLNDACHFAVEEFYAKTNIKIPRVLLVGYFKIFSIINFLRYDAVLDKKYTKMLIWNGGKFRQLIALEIAKIKQIKVYFFENGFLPNTIVFDEKGINYNNSVPRDKVFFENYNSKVVLPTSLVPRVGKNREIFKGEKESLPEKYIFIPFQVDYDTQIISQSPWIKNMRMLFENIEKIAKNSMYHFIIKEHPSSGIAYDDLHQRVIDIKNISFRNTHTTQELIEKSIAVVTINSTVGIESLLFHKKVIVLGEAFYSIEGISYSVKNQKELVSILEKIEILDVNNVLIDNFLKYLYHDYLIPKNNDMYDIFCQKMLKD